MTRFSLMFILLSIVAGVFSAPVDLCLPKVHEVVTSTQVEDSRGRREETHAHIFNDGKAMKVLIHHIEHHSRRTPLESELLDFPTKRHWHWDIRNRTNATCTLTNLEGQYRPECVAHQANMTGNGFIGEDFAYDAYFSEEHRYGYRAEIETLVESKTTSKPLERIERGFGLAFEFFERRTFFDLVESAIPSGTFDIPDQCPKRC